MGHPGTACPTLSYTGRVKSLLLATAVLLYACDRGPTAPRGGLDYDGLAAALRAKGARVETGGPVEQPFFSVRGRFLRVNGEDVQVFVYADEAAAGKDAALVSADGSTIGTAKPFWAGPPHFYRRDRVIVLYVGDAAPVRAALESVLGPQFAGRS